MSTELENWESVAVALTLFPLPVLMKTCYRKVDQYEYDFQPIDDGRVLVRFRPLAGAAAPPAEDPRTQFQRLLTRQALLEQAKEDLRDLRELLAAGAFSLETPAEQLFQKLDQLIRSSAPRAEATAKAQPNPISACVVRGRTLEVTLVAGTAIAPLLRTLSRLHDLSDPVILGHTASGEIKLALTLSDGVDPDGLTKAMVDLLVRCQEGGLPAVYVSDDFSQRALAEVLPDALVRDTQKGRGDQHDPETEGR